MSFSFTPDDVAFLSNASDDLTDLDSVLELTDESLLRDLRIAQLRVGDRAAAVVETIRLRRRAAVKLGAQAEQWLFTDAALQQATPRRVADHRAHRLAGFAVHDVTCSIGADLAALARHCPTVLGSDLDPVRALMAQHNVGARVVVADALRPVSTRLLPYADPARRDAGGRRILSADTIPSVRDLDATWADRPPVLRMPPGVDYDQLARPGEVEIVSLDGTARESVLWPVELATVGRRATVLSTGGDAIELTDRDPDDCAVAPAGRFLIDPDPAIVRAHLVRHFAARHRLWQLDSRLAYLSGDQPPPRGRAFKVLDSAPFREQTVAGWLRAHQVGTLEIKVRGLSVDPDALRRKLRKALGGDRRTGRTLVLARVGQHSVAYLTEAVRPAESPAAIEEDRDHY